MENYMSYNNHYQWPNTAKNLEYCLDDIENNIFDIYDDKDNTKAYIEILTLFKKIKDNDFDIDLLIDSAKRSL